MSRSRTLQQILSAAVIPPGSPDHWSVYDGVALLRVVAAAIPEGLRHPGAADPREVLADASAGAASVAKEWPESASLLLTKLAAGWEPLAPHAWGAGAAYADPQRARARASAAVSFSTRASALAVDRTWPTEIHDNHARTAFYAAREPEVAAEVLVTLRLAVLLLEPLPGIEAVEVATLFAAAPTDVLLVSSERAVPGGRFGEPDARISPVADVPTRHAENALFAITDLLDPYAAAEQLLGPWLATFRDESLFERLRNG
jgi:hypothetical protein